MRFRLPRRPLGAALALITLAALATGCDIDGEELLDPIINGGVTTSTAPTTTAAPVGDGTGDDAGTGAGGSPGADDGTGMDPGMDHGGTDHGGTATGEWVVAPEPVTDVVPSHGVPPDKAHREFQANCAVSRDNAADDPIVFPGQSGASHMHTFLGNTTTDAASTVESLLAGETTCVARGDLSAYWMPTLHDGDEAVNPVGVQTIYYKSGIKDYTSVRPFPTGLRFIAGDMNATAAEFAASPGYQKGFECGDSYDNLVPGDATCGEEGNIKLNVRYQAPSCWDGLHLDSPDHTSHMAYPIDSGHPTGMVCPDSHPVAVPMLEFKMAWPVNGDMSAVSFASGEGYTFHYDFINGWDPATLSALVERCINQGRQCDPHGYEQYDPATPAVLGDDGLLR